MKTKNAVVGSVIEVKETFFNTQGCNEYFQKGLQVLVTDNDMGVYRPLKVTHKDIADGYAWVDAKHFRKVKEAAVEEPTEEPIEHVYKVDDKVLVGSEGAGFGYVDRDLANKVCTVTSVHADGCLRVAHPEVTPTCGYLTHPCYVSPYVVPDTESVQELQEGTEVRITRTHQAQHGEQVQAGDVCEVSHKSQHAPDMYTLRHPNGIFGQLTIHQDDLELIEEPAIKPQVGDWLIGTAVADSNIQQGVAYKVVGFSSLTGRVGIALHTSVEPAWQEVYYINKEDYSKVLRGVQPDADTST